MDYNLYRWGDSAMSTKSKKLSAGSLKTDDGKPIKAGESVFSDTIWQKLKTKEGSEAKLKEKLKVKS